MAKDIFQSESKIAGAWHIDEAVLSIEGGEDLIATGFRMQYGRTVVPYQPINRTGKYLISGPGRGNISLSSIVGPTKSIKAFLDRYANICNAAKNTIVIKPAGITNCDENGGEPVEFIASGCCIQDMTISVDNLGGISVVNSGMTIIINSLEVK